MLDILEKGINIKDLSLESPERKEPTFDPAEFFSEADWREINNYFGQWQPTSRLYKDPIEMLHAIKNIDPARIDKVPNFSQVIRHYSSIEPKLDPYNSSYLMIFNFINSLSPGSIPPETKASFRSTVEPIMRGSLPYNAIGDGFENLAAILTVFPDLKNKVVFDKSWIEEATQSFENSMKVHNISRAAKTAMNLKIVKPDLEFPIKNEDLAKMTEVFKGYVDAKVWNRALPMGMYLKGIYAKRIDTTDTGLKFVMPSTNLGPKQEPLPSARRF